MDVGDIFRDAGSEAGNDIQRVIELLFRLRTRISGSKWFDALKVEIGLI